MKSALVVVMCLIFVGVPCGAVAQTEWTLEPDRPVLESASPGAWDDGFRFVEAVVRVGGEYHMFYRGQKEENPLWGASAIGHAISTDGVSWQLDPSNPVLTPGTDEQWDHGSIRGAAVIHDGSQFRMWYAAVTPSEFGLDDEWHGVGVATSADGSAWLRAEENPIIRPGSNGTFTIPQTVIFDGDRYRMWSVSSSNMVAPFTMTSQDGMTWEGARSLIAGLGRALGLSVVFDGTNHIMMQWGHGYDPYIWGVASPNGYSWTNFVRFPLPLIYYAASPAVLFDNGVFEMWFSRYDGIYRATSTCCPTIYTWFIVAAAHGRGAPGTFYRTEVDVNNAGDETAGFRFAWFPRDRDNSEWHRSELYQLDPGRSVRFSSVLTEVFGLGPGSFGALAVEATSEDVLVVARISTSDDQTAGTYGQSIPILRVDEFYFGDSRHRVLFGANTADARCNVSCFFGRDWPTSRPVEIDIFEADGTLLETRTLRLQPFGSHQINRILSDHGPVNGYVQMRVGYGTYCFGSLIDNQTNDPTTIPPM
jgi:hypothetical protein